MLVVPNLRVLLVPQLFRYQETLPGEEGMFGPAYTSADQQESSVILLDVPLDPIPLRPGGPMVSPVDLLPLLDRFGYIHLVGEPQVADYSQPPIGVSLSQVYGAMTGLITATQPITGLGMMPVPVEPVPGPAPATTETVITEEETVTDTTSTTTTEGGR